MESGENNQTYPLEIYENLPCQSEGLNEKSNVMDSKILFKEGLYATPLRKSDRPKTGRPPIIPRLSEKDAKEDENNAEASKEDVNQDLEERRIRSFLKDTSQMHKRLELQKDMQNTNFSYLARKEHFANLVQQNVIVNDEGGEEKMVEKQDTELIGIEKEINRKERDGIKVGSVQSSPTFRPSRHFEMVDLNREWVLKKIAMCLEQRATKKPIPVLPGVEGIDGAKGVTNNSNLPQLGYLILGSNGSGKTTICRDIQNGVNGTKGLLNRRLLACYFVNSQDSECHSLSSFIRSLVLQILSHSSYLNKEEATSTASDPENLENLPEADQNRDCNRARNESESSILDKELEEIIKEELQQQERDNKLRRQRSEQTEKSSEAPNFYGTHPPLQKAVQEVKESKSQHPSPNKKSKIPVAIGKSPPKPDAAASNAAHNSDQKLSDEVEKQDSSETSDEKTEEVCKSEAAADDTEPMVVNLNDTDATDVTVEVNTIEDEITPPPPPPTKSKAVLTQIADAYYEMLVSNPEIFDSLNIENIEKNPDDSFKKTILFPLLEMSPPKAAQLLLIDSIDENYLNEGSLISTLKGKLVARSRNIAELLSNHIHLFPKWLFLVCTAKKQNKSITKLFTGVYLLSLFSLCMSILTQMLVE